MTQMSRVTKAVLPGMIKQIRGNVFMAVTNIFASPKELLKLYNKEVFPGDLRSFQKVFRPGKDLYYSRFLVLKPNAKEMLFSMIAKRAMVPTLTDYESHAIWKDVCSYLKPRILVQKVTYTDGVFSNGKKLNHGNLYLVVKELENNPPESSLYAGLIRDEVFDSEVRRRN